MRLDADTPDGSDLNVLKAMVLVVFLLTVGVFVAPATAGTTERVSVSSGGFEANDTSQYSAISADGRYVAFASHASNLVSDDMNDRKDVFVRDTVAARTTRVSVASDGTESNADSSAISLPSISADGRYVAFVSDASNLVAGDTNENRWGLPARDVFVHDSLTGQTERVSVASDGTQGNGNSKAVSISPEGRYVAFASYASNLVPGDTNKDDMGSPALDVFVHDRVTGQTERVSVASDGTQGNDESWGGSISANGRYVAFCSSATNLVPGDTNGESDIFVRDRQTGTTTRVNVASDGTQAHSSSDLWYAEGSYGGSISADGRYVAFTSYANNLVPGDTNENSMGLPVRDIFVHDRMTGETERVSVASDGTQSNDYSAEENISADGRYVAFLSGASNLVPEDTNGHGDVFVHDRRTGETSRISVSSNGVAGDGYSHCAAISADGRYVAFESEASNLVRRDMNFEADIFIHDRGIPGHNVAINAGPAGDANPAESGADVQCSVTAECSEGHSLSYQWTAEDGEGNPAGTFDDATAQNPAWTAPVNDTSASVDYTISVTVTCSEGAEASGSFTQTVYPAGRPPAYICVNDHPDDNGTQMDLVWPASPDDGSGSDTVTGYNVFRKPRGGTMVFVGSVDAVDAGPYEYTDTGLQPQTLYYYAVRAVSETGASGAVGRWRKTVNDQLPPPGDITDLDAHDRP
ncbi:MAG: fibronectin type III domain-containing protein, partial [Armatimonadota bacterium]